jgi:antitoxin component of MazEF toxin-antitoxin module
VEVRKIFKAGNSCVVSLPLDMLKALGLKDGSHLTVEINREKRELVMKPVIVKSNTMSVDFVRQVNKLMVDFEHVLRRIGR